MPNAAEEKAPFYGIADDEEMRLILDTLLLDTSEFSEGPYADFKGTIIGLEHIPGGAEKTSARTGEPYIEKDKMAMHWRIDNGDEIELEADPFTKQFFTLPSVVSRDGKLKRGRPMVTSTWATFLNAASALGVSATPSMATAILLRNASDFIGIKFHRQRTAMDSYDGSTYNLDLPIEFLGVDNAVRKENGLDPLTPVKA